MIPFFLGKSNGSKYRDNAVLGNLNNVHARPSQGLADPLPAGSGVPVYGVGQRIGKYLVTAVLRPGRAYSAYRAVHPQLGIDVVVQLYHPLPTLGPDGVVWGTVETVNVFDVIMRWQTRLGNSC